MSSPTEAPSPVDLQLFYEPPGTLRLTIAEQRSYPKVALYQASPLLRPGKYLSFLDGKGEEIVLVQSLEELTPQTRAVAQEELKRRYLTAKLKRIEHIKNDFGITYWHVETDRGVRDFVVQSLSESCLWLSDSQILIVDVDGNRFEIEDRYALDEDSRAQLEKVL